MGNIEWHLLCHDQLQPATRRSVDDHRQLQLQLEPFSRSGNRNPDEDTIARGASQPIQSSSIDK
jgi:hypothetical protein